MVTVYNLYNLQNYSQISQNRKKGLLFCVYLCFSTLLDVFSKTLVFNWNSFFSFFDKSQLFLAIETMVVAIIFILVGKMKGLMNFRWYFYVGFTCDGLPLFL